MSQLNIPSRLSEGSSNQHLSRITIDFNGGEGTWKIYNKDTEEKTILPYDKLVFMVLARTNHASGYYKPDNTGYYSNEIINSKNEKFTIKSNKGEVLAEGLWADIKPIAETKKISFHAKLYCLVKLKGVFELADINLKSTALVKYSNLADELEKKTGDYYAIYKSALMVESIEKKKNGTVSYVTPKFKTIPVSDASNELANEKTKEVIAFLNTLITDNGGVVHQEASEESTPVQMDEKKTLSFADPAFANIMANLSSGQTTLIDVKRKYDMEKPVEDALRSAEQAAIGMDEEKEEAPKAEPTPAPVSQDIDDLGDDEDELPF